jgi:hypothetical protein
MATNPLIYNTEQFNHFKIRYSINNTFSIIFFVVFERIIIVLHYIKLKRLAREKHSSLLSPFLS